MPSIGSRGRRERRDRAAAGADRLLAVLPLIAFLLYALTSPGLTCGDAAGVYATAAALVEHGTFAIDGATAALAPAPDGADAGAARSGPLAYAAGHYYHDAPPGPAILAAPAYALGLVLAPLSGPEAPAVLVGLLGPLLGALAVAGLARLLRAPDSAPRRPHPVLPVAAGAILLLPWVHAPAAPVVSAALACWLLPALVALWRGRAAPLQAGAVGLGLATFLLLDYGLGLLAAAVLLATLARLRRGPRAMVALLAGAARPVLVLAAYATVAFGRPWRPGFLFAVDHAAGSPLDLSRPAALVAVGVPLALALAVAAVGLAARSRPALARPIRVAALALTLALAPWPVLAALAGRRDAAVLPFDWRAPAALLPLLAVAALLAALLGLARLGGARRWRGAAVPTTVLLIAAALVGSGGGRAASAAAPDGAGYAAPFAIAVGDRFEPVWTVARETRFDDPRRLPLAARARAVSPWIDVRPGEVYRVRLDHTGPLQVLFAWEDLARRPLVQQAAAGPAGGTLDAGFAAPVGAAGLRLHLVAGDAPAAVANLRLTLARGARVEPFPDYSRAALAFSFDWESAMGGLIHSRSGAGPGGAPGEGERVALGADGAPSVAEAEAKGLRMREGAAFLAGEFARHDIRATYYATGYNLLPGNPACEKFLGDPLYPNADTRNGWGSDYWKTHRWFEHDPCATEAAAPAWYFASQTRDLAAAGHEIASHTFGHLYVRGVEPEQLAADLALWDRAARGLDLPPAYSFAFPWTSSNSLDDRFFAVFERRGIAVLTRLYPLDLRHPYELDRVKDHPDLAVFPDGYLPSTPEAQDKALASIDQTLARRGYHSLWTHPNEALEQGGPVIWPRVIAYAAAARERGLWIAPVAEIARHGLATRQVAVTALPVAGGMRLTVENRSGGRLDGLTLALPAGVAGLTVDGRASTDARGGQLRLPPLEPGARVVVTARR